MDEQSKFAVIGTGMMEDLYSQSVISPSRLESRLPSEYRLVTKNGTLSLQGRFDWSEGWTKHGREWRDIPTVNLDHNQD